MGSMKVTMRNGYEEEFALDGVTEIRSSTKALTG